MGNCQFHRLKRSHSKCGFSTISWKCPIPSARTFKDLVLSVLSCFIASLATYAIQSIYFHGNSRVCPYFACQKPWSRYPHHRKHVEVTQVVGKHDPLGAASNQHKMETSQWLAYDHHSYQPLELDLGRWSEVPLVISRPSMDQAPKPSRSSGRDLGSKRSGKQTSNQMVEICQ